MDPDSVREYPRIEELHVGWKRANSVRNINQYREQRCGKPGEFS